MIVVHTAMFPYALNAPVTAAERFNWWTVDIYGAVGYMGVPLFVMLSGVLLLNPAKDDESLTSFFKKRLVRIGIPTIFWTIAYFIWANQVHNTPLTPESIFGGLLSGSYTHLWFLYLLIGLYSVTPALRILVKHLNQPKFTYFLAVWFIGTVLVPFMAIFLPNVGYNPVMFVFTGWTGCYVLGVYLLKNKNAQWALWVCLLAGLAVAVIGDAAAPYYVGNGTTGFFHEYLSFNIILASAALFLLLASIPASKIQNSDSIFSRLVCWLGKNTLGIYLVHVMVLETLQNGYLGVQLNMALVSPVVEVPLLSAVVLVLTSVIVFGLSKVPYVNRILG